MNFYQNLPQIINPVFVNIGSFTIYWYSIMWIIAFFSVYLLLSHRIKNDKEVILNIEELQDVIFYSLFGAIIGGRIGYVIFYNLNSFLVNPISIISPYNFETGVWTGIYGMSYHGGALGIFFAIFYYAYKTNKSWFKIINYAIPAIPFGYFFGRIGNFLNGELYGRITNDWIGMNFTGEGFRHPSQLYEAFGEGIILFIILWTLRNKENINKYLLSIYVMGYAIVRFIIEFFREPDEHIGLLLFNLSMGQLLSSFMFVIGFVIFLISYKRKVYFKKFE